jgi:hypothetical protein
MLALRLSLLAVGVLGVGPPRPAGANGALQSLHAVVEGDVPFARLEEATSLVEALWPHLVETFGSEPARADLPLCVRLFPDRASFETAVRAAGCHEDLERTGGWTSLRPPTSFVVVQPEPFDTRRLVLRESVHQFQARLVGAAAEHEPQWHREGLAEWFGWHRRTSRGIVFGAMDAIALRHRPRAVARRVASEGLDAWAIVSERAPADPTDGLGLVAALRSARDPLLGALYARWSREAVRGRSSGRRFARWFSGHGEALDAAVRITWSDFVPPWSPDGAGWDEEPAGVTFSGAVESTLLGGVPLPGGVPRATARVLLPDGGEAALAVGDPALDEWVIACVTSGEVRLLLRSGGAEEMLARAPCPPGPARRAVSLGVGRAEDRAFLIADTGGPALRLDSDPSRPPLPLWSSGTRARLRARGSGVLFVAIRLGSDARLPDEAAGSR